MKRHSLIYLAGSVLAALSLPTAALWVGDKRAKQESPSKLPAALDLLKYQTSVRNQSGRGGCPYFAPVAALARFEEILASEHEIVFTLMVHDDIHQLDPAQPVWRLKPGSRPIGNHFMLMIGYDSQRKFFIVKNQWGPTNYSGQKDRLAPGWEDIVRYNGYTLVDYNYLSACGEGHWITELIPADSLRFNPQQALGQWSITFTRKNKLVTKGVLCWRRCPAMKEVNWQFHSSPTT